MAIMRHTMACLYFRGVRSRILHEGTKMILTVGGFSRAPIRPPYSNVPYEKAYVRFMTSSLPPDSEPPATKTTTVEIKEDNTTTLLPFPWRVNATEPLPRVVLNDDYSGMELTPWARFVRKAYVALELNTSWMDIILWKKWENELAQSCAFAFQRAMCGLVSRSFQVPLKDICDFKDINCKSLSIHTRPDSHMTDEDKQFVDDYVAGVLDPSLLQLYNTTRASQLKVHFSLTLIRVRLENAFMIPHLTRSDVHADSSLRGAYTAIEKKWRETRDTDAIIDMGRDLQVKTKHHGTKRSLMVDVSVVCRETFQLRDGETGKVLLGDDGDGSGGGDDENENDKTLKLEEKLVTHLVRFEMETDQSGNDTRELGHWKIVDIDDMLKGNVWY